MMQRRSTRIRRGRALLGAVVLCIAQRLPARAEGFTISSPAFPANGRIPKKYTCDRANISPPLRWNGAPPGTKSFAVIAEDPEVPVGSWAFWVLYDLPAEATGVRQGVPPTETLPGGAKQGLNEFGGFGYRGPCPPPGHAHQYWFRVYALDAPTKLQPRATKAELYRVIRRHVLRVAEVMGSYERAAIRDRR